MAGGCRHLSMHMTGTKDGYEQWVCSNPECGATRSRPVSLRHGRAKTDGPVPDYTIPVRLTADDWDYVCEALANRRRHRADVIRTEIVNQTVTEEEPF